MKNKKEHILVRIGKEKFYHCDDTIYLLGGIDSNSFVNDLNNYPHAFVFACCMDRQTTSERAWTIPLKIKEIIGSFDMPVLISKSLDEYKVIFANNNLHRFNDKMAEVFYKAVQKIHNDFHDDASLIWKDNPSSATVVYRFLEFDGVGIKIATMATNLLARHFKIPFSDYYSIDVSPDIHVRRVMKRLGLIKENDNNNMIIYKARELYPEFPGIIDDPLWEIGRKWCRPNNPDCENCIVKSECPKNM